MLDLKYVVENRDQVLAMLRSRGQSLEAIQAGPDLSGTDPWTLDGERRALIQDASVVHDHQSVAQSLGLLHVVGGEDEGHAARSQTVEA